MRLRPPAAPNLRATESAQWMLAVPFFLISLGLWFAAIGTDGPVMDVEVYGPFVVGFPAEAWAGAIMAATTIWMLGILINGDWQGSPALRVAGTTAMVLILGAFAVSASATAYGDVLVIGGGVFALAHAVAAVWAAADMVHALRGDADGGR